jgi:RimJ/RimL family protein N-acetyltransferase
MTDTEAADLAEKPSERPVVNIAGQLVALGPLRRDLMPTYQRWINDFQTLRTLGTAPRPMRLEDEQAWYDGQTGATDRVNFTIYERSTWRPIGNTGFHEIDLRNRAAVFGILIGEADARGKGYGTEATRLMLDYGFTALSLHSVMLAVFSYNVAGLRAYAKAGFRECGRRRQSHLMNGCFWDTVYMDCLASEFTSPILGRVFAPDEPRGERSQR